MKKIVLVGLAASLPAFGAEPATVPPIRRAPGGAPTTTTQPGIKDPAALKLRAPGSEYKRPEYKEHKDGAYGELKSPGGSREFKSAGGAGEFKSTGGAAEYKSPAGRELKAPSEYKEGKFHGDAAPEAPPAQREGPVRY
jgi:hypothetical protein